MKSVGDVKHTVRRATIDFSGFGVCVSKRFGADLGGRGPGEDNNGQARIPMGRRG